MVSRGHGRLELSRPIIIPSALPSFLLPCPECAHRMVIEAVTPVPVEGSNESSGLDDITYGCEACGTTLTRTVRA